MTSNTIYVLDSSDVCTVLDLPAAFNTIDHYLLLCRLHTLCDIPGPYQHCSTTISLTGPKLCSLMVKLLTLLHFTVGFPKAD